MTTITNLNRFRKQQKRAEKQKQAEENRVKYGRTKAEKQKALHEEDARKRHLDGHERAADEDA